MHRKMKNFLLTLDYELYGNGSGDVFRNVVEPTARLLQLAHEKNVRYTFFFEVVEYWFLKREWENGNKMGYDRDPAAAMAAQMRQAVAEGHDVQLHIHSQWCDAEWMGDHWQVATDNSQWRMPEMRGDMDALLLRGKQTLEDMLCPVKPDYRCTTFRAGWYNAMPCQRQLHAMRGAGFVADSSVVPGAVETGQWTRYDYSASPVDAATWFVQDDIDKPAAGKTDILELPIVTMPIRRITKYLSWSRIKSILHNRKSAAGALDAKTTADDKPKGKLAKLAAMVKFLFSIEWQTWDVCLFSTAMNKKFIKAKVRDDRDVYVLVGHPKGLTDTTGLEYLIDCCRQEYDARFCTVHDILAVTDMARNK